ncbi:alpha-glucuronidase [Sphingomonas sp. QA11]|uniref:alpha-glucuronidase family glycosyl hydrolase n=1 Tax=Sphingomonas sp. QA11 TaxID=2950605 RepID=UPI002349704D|nr:alpha-glucuronidase family glycosyl hydrolase [Sphingomonas sp. QA11]WCM25808.1 alpha-glucuronidase [Sphingomonas sp. QA11]
MGRLIAWCAALFLTLGVLPVAAHAEDGYDLWLRYRPLPADIQARDRVRATAVVFDVDRHDIPTLKAVDEIERALEGMLGAAVPTYGQAVQANAIVLGTSAEPRIKALNLPLGQLGTEGYVIRSATIDGKPVTVVAANSGVGVLYGSFALIQHLQRGLGLDRLDIVSAPKLKLRLLNHWDNLDRTVERGYAGQSIWDWWKLPDFREPRYTDYARANASIGINGTVLNNVNAKADSLTAPYIAKAAALADVFRPYGIKVYLSARWSAPIEIGGLRTADPLDPQVAAWWKAKADEIYRAIPDFGGFLVKANSEGQPGPQDYKRNHAEGANMLAAAVRPHGGIIMWRAFVYQHENPEDRAKQAYDDFKPLDGKFADNVIVQVKNGAIDFQPREPFHPLFGAMPKTPLMMEFQITKEYLGMATHLAYLGPLYEEVLQADTFAKGKGSTVARVIEGALDGYKLTGMAGVANIGTDRDWSGSTFNQANWFVYGRMAWNPEASAKQVSGEWSELTFGPDPAITPAVVNIMTASREAVVNYMTPLGLAHLMATSHHFGPGPWVKDLARPEWNPVYYHKADRNGIGYDRTRTGSDAVAQYAPEVARMFADVKTTPERDLLWFHHVGWDDRLKSGKTLWDELVARYTLGVGEVADMHRAWRTLAPHIDRERFAKTDTFLSIQQKEAQWWRDASLAYWTSVSGRPLPAGETAPAKTLPEYEAISWPYEPGR